MSKQNESAHRVIGAGGEMVGFERRLPNKGANCSTRNPCMGEDRYPQGNPQPFHNRCGERNAGSGGAPLRLFPETVQRFHAGISNGNT